MLPHVKKGKRLKMQDLLKLPHIDGEKTFLATKVAKAYRLTPEEIKAWHNNTWHPPETIVAQN